jgi:hypothetical protein
MAAIYREGIGVHRVLGGLFCRRTISLFQIGAKGHDDVEKVRGLKGRALLRKDFRNFVLGKAPGNATAPQVEERLERLDCSRSEFIGRQLAAASVLNCMRI